MIIVVALMAGCSARSVAAPEAPPPVTSTIVALPATPAPASPTPTAAPPASRTPTPVPASPTAVPSPTPLMAVSSPSIVSATAIRTAVATAVLPGTTKPSSRGVPQSGRGACPGTHPIKGNQGSRSTTDWIYHVPGGGSYGQTDPEECFANEADAQAAGYRRARN
ncbi:MAG: hypothetical protein ACKVVP_10340 [Chloroflexota bacterium]